MGPWSCKREAGAVEVSGLLRPRPGGASRLALGAGAMLVAAALALFEDPVSAGLGMLGGGVLATVGLRRILLGSLEHRTRFSPGLVVREESGTETPQAKRVYGTGQLRCVGLAALQAGALGSERRLYLVQEDRGLLLLARERGPESQLRPLGEELAAVVGLPFEEAEGWPRHEWKA